MASGNAQNPGPVKGIVGLKGQSSVDLLNRSKLNAKILSEILNKHFHQDQSDNYLESMYSMDTYLKLLAEEVNILMRARNATSPEACLSCIKEINRMWVKAQETLSVQAQRYYRSDWFLLYCYHIAFPAIKQVSTFKWDLNTEHLSRQVHCFRLKKEGRWVDKHPVSECS